MLIAHLIEVSEYSRCSSAGSIEARRGSPSTYTTSSRAPRPAGGSIAVTSLIPPVSATSQDLAPFGGLYFAPDTSLAGLLADRVMIPSSDGRLHCGRSPPSVRATGVVALPPFSGGLHCGIYLREKKVFEPTSAPAVRRRAPLRRKRGPYRTMGLPACSRRSAAGSIAARRLPGGTPGRSGCSRRSMAGSPLRWR